MISNNETIRCLNENLMNELLIRLSQYSFDDICNLFIEFCQPIIESNKYLLTNDIDLFEVEVYEFDFENSYKLTIDVSIILNEFIVQISFSDKTYSMLTHDGKMSIIANKPIKIQLTDRNNGKGLKQTSCSKDARLNLPDLLKII